MTTDFIAGIDNSGDNCDNRTEFFCEELISKLGARFVVYHLRQEGTAAEETQLAAQMAEKFHGSGLQFVVNCERANWADHIVSSDGFDWVDRADGGHRFRFPDAMMKAYAAVPEFAGITYDEMEHAILNRHMSVTLSKGTRKNIPFFPPFRGKDILKAGKQLEKDVRALITEYKDAGSPKVLWEPVFPAYSHVFAKCGMDVCFKQQKEHYSNIHAAVAMGAALEYGRELWSCVDLWFRNRYPGHSPEEMYHNLVFAYLIGCDRAYVESLGAMHIKHSNTLNAHGEAYERFTREFLKDKKREYSFRDYLPSIGIIRHDDGDWGQDGIIWKRILYGSKTVHANRKTREWVRAWNTITHGESKKGALSLDNVFVYGLKKHRSFAPADAPVVFDSEVKKELLESLKLCFLCGIYVSPETLLSVARLVKENGLTAVAPKRFAPAYILNQCSGSFSSVRDGKGTWIVAEDPASRKVKKAVSGLIGKTHEMTYRFRGGITIRMRISDNGETFTYTEKRE